MNIEEDIANIMDKSKAKSVLLIAFTFIGSYATLVIVYPYSFWRDYFSLPTSKLIIDVLVNLLFCVAIFRLSIFIDRILNKKISWMVHPIKRLLIQTIFQILGALFLIICLSYLYYKFGDLINTQTYHIGLRELLYTVISIILWALMISALNTGDFLLKNWKTATLKAAEYKVKAAESKQLVAEIELQALKLQLDPHFVFNNLSVLSELILKDQQLGYEYTENFTKVYRYLLINSKKKLVPLSEELKFLDAYLFLIKNRMGGGSVFRINIDESKLDMLIPPVTLQLFIENALKFNRTEEENPLVVCIYSNENDELVVSNTRLPLIKKPYSTGIGLKNIISRYALLCDRKPSIEENDETFVVKVPLIKR
ncbi:Histidine kinase [Olivibacter domesticus]|uniref:Histidine kinase n=2 Tax=Olivibacter domesticus TaxID=407022 RepID=A0A1H7K4W1_OLID1|nr:Histidine kinase [Olivibacter domesticus]